MQLYPFASKELPNIQKKLFRRLHGVSTTLTASGDTVVEFEIPYNWAKITTIEIVGLPCFVACDFTVLDTVTGSISQTGISKLQLNKFGFDVNISKDYHRDHSDYEADLYKGMFLRLVFKNGTAQSGSFGVNFTLHEVV